MAIRALLQVAQKTLVCSVCYDLLRQPVAFPCGHVFCKICAERCVEGRPQCPLCNHAVSSRRCTTPLPTLTSLTILIHDVAKSLRLQQQLQQQSAAALALGSAEITENTCAGLLQENNMKVEQEKEKEEYNNNINNINEDSNTQLLSTPPPLIQTSSPSHPSWDETETPLVQRSTPTLSLTLQCVAICRSSNNNNNNNNNNSSSYNSSDEIVYEYGGCCALCGLDIRNRIQMYEFLQRLRSLDFSCDRKRIRQLTELQLSDYLGPMWDLHLTNGGNDLLWSLPSNPLLVHQTCLEWCVLRHSTNGSHRITIEMTDNSSQRYNSLFLLFLSFSSVRRDEMGVCSFCEERRGMCLIPCCNCKRRAYHFPCALLTGTGVCEVLPNIGSLMCVECYTSHNEQ